MHSTGMARYKGELLVLGSTLAWGMSYIFIKAAMQSFDVFHVVALRFTVACAITALVFNRHLKSIGRKEVVYGGVLGLLLFVSTSLLAVGLRYTSISSAGFIIGSMVLFVAVMDSIVRWKRPHPGLLAGIVFALAGIAILTLRGELSVNTGDLLCLGSTLALAIHVMLAQRTALRADVIGASIIQFLATATLAWAASLAAGTLRPSFSGGALLAVMGLGVFGTAAAFVCQVAGQKYISPTRTAFIFTLEPIFATFFAWLFVQEQVTWHVFVGGGLLLAGVYISEFRRGGDGHDSVP